MNSSIIATLAERARIDPQAIALIGSDEIFTAQRLHASVLACAEQLRAARITALALHADNSPAWIVVDLACQYANIRLVPLPLFFSASQLEHAIKSSAIDALISHKPLRSGSAIIHIACLKLAGLTCQQFAPGDIALPNGTDKITFTSGSTGDPKGVCLTTQQQLSVAQGIVERLQLTDVCHLCLLPLSTLLENIAGVYAPLLANGCVIAPSLGDLGMNGSSGLEIEKLLSRISRYQASSLILVPELLLALLGACQNGWQAPQSLSFIAVGGGKVSPFVLQSAREHGLPVYEGYGLSECSSVVCLNAPTAHRTGSVGKPLSPLDVYIKEGEIQVSGSAFLGYVNDPASWQQSEVATGDLGHIDSDGFVFIEGRRGNRLISSFGRNISPEWVESELLAGPLLAQAVVIGDAQPYCAALIYPRKPQTSADEIEQWIASVNQQLPDYARIQRWHRLQYALSSDSQLLTANGRPRRQAIQGLLATEINALYESQQEH
ncbi:MAG: AMP-binding protein [Gammaproteobacteria bacterium]|nr:AMP-binding protein [Gammaproteobacteria bacterium]MBQ0838812.1 AMP-binding protein [Gammaproteobacteria bacterium]